MKANTLTLADQHRRNSGCIAGDLEPPEGDLVAFTGWCYLFLVGVSDQLLFREEHLLRSSRQGR